LSEINPEWMGFDNKVGTTLASARALRLDLLSYVWLHISGGLNCCQEFRRGIVMNIEWDYNYYQPWSDNEWLVDEMLAMLDEDVTMQ